MEEPLLRSVPAKPTNKRRIIVRDGGRTKVGKTSFGLSAPGPIAYFNLNNRAEHVIDNFIADKEIHVFNYHKIITAEKSEWEDQWKMFNDDFLRAVEHQNIRSIVWDTENDSWEIRRLAEFGRESSIPTAYNPLNKDMRNLFERVNESDKNLVVISEMKKKYISKIIVGKNGPKEISAWDGESYEMAGWGNVGNKVQVNLVSKFDPMEKEFTVEVINCGINSDVTGAIYKGNNCTFPMLAIDVFPETDLEDWE